MNSTEKMRSTVQQIRKEAKAAQERHTQKRRKIEMMSSRSLDYFSTSFRGDLTDILREVRDANMDLYSTGQALIFRLDEQCRPLLRFNPQPHAVQGVVALFDELIGMCTIRTNFSGTLNGSNMGQIANLDYSPSMESLTIQKYWESTYRSMPGVREMEERQRQEARAEEERRDRERDEQRKAEEKKRQEAQEKEALRVRALIPEELAKVRHQIEEKYGAGKKQLALQKLQKTLLPKQDALEAEKASLTAELETLGFFKFADKKRVRNRLTEIGNQLQKNQQQLDSAANAAAEAKTAAERALYWREKDIQLYMESDPSFWNQYETFLRPLYEIMEDGVGYTITQLIEKHPVDMTSQKMTSLFRMKDVKKRYRRETFKGISYFYLLDPKEWYNRDPEGWYD